MIEKLSELFDTEDSMYEFMDSYFNLYETDLTIDNIEEFNWDKVAIEKCPNAQTVNKECSKING